MLIYRQATTIDRKAYSLRSIVAGLWVPSLSGSVQDGLSQATDERPPHRFEAREQNRRYLPTSKQKQIWQFFCCCLPQQKKAPDLNRGPMYMGSRERQRLWRDIRGPPLVFSLQNSLFIGFLSNIMAVQRAL